MTKEEKPVEITHDSYLRKQFRQIDFARSYFQENLPESFQKIVDWDTLRLAPDDFVNKALKNRRTDILYLINAKRLEIFLHLHVEHQRKVDMDMPIRLMLYMANIWSQHRAQYPKKPIPLVYSMVIYQGKRKWTAARTLHDYLKVPKDLKDFVPNFKYGLMHLKGLADDEIKGILMVRLVLLIMKYIDSPDLNQILEERVLPLVKSLLESKSGLEIIQDMLYYLADKGKFLDEEKTVKLFQSIKTTEPIQELMMTLGEKWEARGETNGKIQMIEKLLASKFRKENAQLWLKKLAQYPPTKLDIIGENILTANTIEEVFKI
ncbi:MAG: Rpn family recombination-promoting nuclease/putative transposase [Mesoflavibacter sp.]|nr:Rpn family recombination-promoting nuclease/putative transposase [Mesoflavibacter sp.]